MYVENIKNSLVRKAAKLEEEINLKVKLSAEMTVSERDKIDYLCRRLGL